MTIVDVRKLSPAEICKVGSNTAAQIKSDRRLIDRLKDLRDGQNGQMS